MSKIKAYIVNNKVNFCYMIQNSVVQLVPELFVDNFNTQKKKNQNNRHQCTLLFINETNTLQWGQIKELFIHILIKVSNAGVRE